MGKSELLFFASMIPPRSNHLRYSRRTIKPYLGLESLLWFDQHHLLVVGIEYKGCSMDPRHNSNILTGLLASMAGGIPVAEVQKICSAHNHMIHGDPLSCCNNLIALPDGAAGYASSKILNNSTHISQISFTS